MEEEDPLTKLKKRDEKTEIFLSELCIHLFLDVFIFKLDKNF